MGGIHPTESSTIATTANNGNEQHNQSEAAPTTITKSRSHRKVKRLNGLGIDHFSLKKRMYLGPTSMDAELSFIMTNLGQVRTGCCVLDPFVGTDTRNLSASALRNLMVVTFNQTKTIRILREDYHDPTNPITSTIPTGNRAYSHNNNSDDEKVNDNHNTYGHPSHCTLLSFIPLLKRNLLKRGKCGFLSVRGIWT